MSGHSDAYTALEQHIAALRSEALNQFGENTQDSLSISDIDALEFSLEQNVGRMLRSLRNSRQPCNRIPPEVITRIAHYCSSPTFDTPWYTCLLKSTHLCHRWREIITSCPSLWTLILNQPLNLASIFLERSGDLPLNVHTMYRLCYESAHLRRIKTLRLRAYGHRELSNVFSRLTIPSPVITEVAIDMVGDTYEYCPCLPPLFSDMSTIRSLSLGGVSFSAQFLRFTSLTSFSLHIPGALFSPFLDLLAANPALEFISISVWGPITTEQVDSPIITLNNLISIHCRDAAEFLLSRLSLPCSTLIQIEDTGPPLSLSRTLPTPITNIRHLAQIDSLSLTTTTVLTCSGQPMDSHRFTLVGRCGPVDIHWVVGYGGPREFDPQPLSFDYVKELTIAHQTSLECPRASKLDLSPLFNATRRLEVLKLCSCLPADCHSILSPFADNRTCPSLHTVEIINCSGQVQWLSALLPIATQRRNVGLALRKVLVSPHLSADLLVQKYIREFSGVLSDPTETDNV